MTAIVITRACPLHGPQTAWRQYQADLDNPRSARVFECVVSLGTTDVCGLELGREREYIPLAAALDAVREETKGYGDRPRRVVELVERRLRRTRKAA